MMILPWPMDPPRYVPVQRAIEAQGRKDQETTSLQHTMDLLQGSMPSFTVEVVDTIETEEDQLEVISIESRQVPCVAL